ncbi:MDR family MFS transporter [Methanobacterium sp. MBAC-LM]|uniref:MDR family MFS transporter n=1 Tax=Methanobacterium sp. MBAC-LM TaxID=3412034 RepID=UPI003C7696CB
MEDDFKNLHKEEDKVIEHIPVIIAGLLISLFIVALDSTITSTAMPKIIASLGGLQYYVWPFTIYLVTSIISTMLSGKLSDFYGSKKVLISGIIIFVIGSIFCGFSQNMAELIIFRALQGLGAGIIFVLPLKIVAEMFPPRQRGKYIGILSAAGGISSIVGPVIGGFITDFLGWQWIFFLNVPIGIITIAILLAYFPNLEIIVKDKIMDYFGILTFTGGLTSFLLALELIQQNNGISTLWIVLLFSTAAIMLILFIYTEKNAKEAVLPLYLFKNSVYNVSAILSIINGAVSMGAVVYIPLFLQEVQGMTASASGASLIPLLLGMVIASMITGQLITKTGTYKIYGIISFGISIIGMILLTTMNINTDLMEVGIYAVVSGIGMGMALPIITLAAQNSVSKRDLGVVTASSQYIRLLGSVVGLAIIGAIVNATLNINLQNSHINVSTTLLTTAIHDAFLICVIMNIIGFIISFFLKDLHLSNEMEEIGYEESPGEPDF